MSQPGWRSEWVNEKCKIARALAGGAAGAGYAEAAILVCAALSALAAEVWPGLGVDKVRFVELLVRFGASASKLKTISVPLLLQKLDKGNAQLLRKTLPRVIETRVDIGSDIDKTESELLSLCPALDRSVVRSQSYACLLYDEVRSSYTHEYRPGKRAESWQMTMASGEAVSYVNRCEDPQIGKVAKLIHFHIDWLTKVAVDLAPSIDARSSHLPLKQPSKWWKNGAP